ncbi:dienelactone hydrolase family protein [Paenibacillus hamazuiensis]|uniref:dienelactone hydrolase family protein n=1 Tax=Paenibacillus hamazuiensis TaxID=2936508 RepID=UPI0020102BA9|nr:alpha/beta hydrolase family protein [Paenibacillus hamazuiensis]
MRQPDGYLNRLYDELQEKRENVNEPWEQKRVKLLKDLKASLGDFELPARETPFEDVLLERVELDEAIRERVEFTTLGGLRMPAYFMKPKHLQPGEKRPAVLLWHGHGYGSKSMVGLQEDGTPKLASGKPSDNLALELVRRGCVVLAPDEAGMGDRKLERDMVQDPELKNSCYNLSVSLFMTGKTTAGLRAYEAIRAADYLAGREEADPARMGNMGHSGGGTVASLSAALDERIKASVVGLYPNTYRGSILAMRHCLCNYIPGILRHAEMPDLLGLIAPRALFVEAGIHDPIYPVETTREAIRRLTALYGELGCPEQFDSHLYEGKHEISGERSLDWLAAVLSR